jgi:hypothetical protein
MSNTLGMSLEDVVKRLSTLEAMYCNLQSQIAGHEMNKRRVEAKADDVEEEMKRLRLHLVMRTKTSENIKQ